MEPKTSLGSGKIAVQASCAFSLTELNTLPLRINAYGYEDITLANHDGLH